MRPARRSTGRSTGGSTGSRFLSTTTASTPVREGRRTVARFAVVGATNTLIDIALFMLLVTPTGVVVANFVSTSAGMTFSFVVNGLFTFAAGSLTVRHAARFVSTTGVTMWVVQPLIIYALLTLAHQPLGLHGDFVVLAVKVVAIGVSVVLNFLAYRFVVWPVQKS